MSTNPEILYFSEKFSFYFTICNFVIGIIGNISNLLILITLKPFRSNQCAFYIIIESIVDVFQLSMLFAISTLPITTGFTPESYSIIWCKLRNVLPQFFRLLSTCMVCFAAFDQFLSTNPTYLIRKLSSLQLARRLTILSVCAWIIHSIPYSIFYQVVPLKGCILTSVTVTYYYSYFYYPILHGTLPILISCLCSLLAYRNVRRIVRRQINIERRRLDQQLTAMIFVRVIAFVNFLIPYTIYRIYILNSTNNNINSYPYAINQLIYSITASLSNLNYTVRLLLDCCFKTHRIYYFRQAFTYIWLPHHDIVDK